MKCSCNNDCEGIIEKEFGNLKIPYCEWENLFYMKESKKLLEGLKK